MAYQWLIAKEFAPDNIAFGGDSAGGGLTLATLLYLRDKEKPLPACAICLSPWTDLTLSGASFSDKKAEDPMLIKEAFPFWAQNYYGNHDPKTPYISPLFADCTGLPPIYIHVGSDELLLSDSTRFCEKAKAEGVEVEMEIFKNYFHVFHRHVRQPRTLARLLYKRTCMSKSPLFSYILLDRSGSMEDCRDTTIDAFNQYVMGLRRSAEVDARVTLTIFDSQSIDTLQQAEPAKSSIELSRQSYVPRATTPLLDAIGHAVADIDKVELRDGEKVGLVILTDGLENASKEHTKETIRKLLTDRQDNKGWLVTFLGADIDAFAEAGAIGIKGGNYLALKKGKLRESMGHTFASQARYARSGDFDDAAFLDTEREDANDDSAKKA